MPMHPLKATKSVAGYLAALPPKERVALQKVRQAILKAAPQAEECIRYGIPAYLWQGPFLYLAAHAKHLSLHGVNNHLQQELAGDLSKFEVSGSTLHFSPERPPSAALLKKIVRLRLDWNGARAIARLEAKSLRKRSL